MIDTPPFRAPDRSRATRAIPARSRASSRGVVVAQLPADSHPRQIVFESKLEQHVLFLMLARRDVYDVRDQPPPISYCDENGRISTHYFDYLLKLTSGRRLALAVKPWAIAEKTRFREQLARISAATDLSYADHVILITDRSFRRVDALNAARLHLFRRQRNRHADQIIATLARQLHTPVTIAELCRLANLGEHGFAAIFRAIYAGLLTPRHHGEITSFSLVHRAEDRAAVEKGGKL